MSKLTLDVQKRETVGRKVKKLRKEGIIPGNIYGKKVKSMSVQVDGKVFGKIFTEAGETQLIELILNGDKKPVLIHNIQKDPVNDNFLHVDFLQVDLSVKVTARVPVELVNDSPAEKQGLGTAVQQLMEIEVEALPGDLPEKFEIDLSNLAEVDQMVQIKDLKVDKNKVEVKNGEEEIVVKVEPPKTEEEVAPPTTEEAVEGEEVPAESEPQKTEETEKSASE